MSVCFSQRTFCLYSLPFKILHKKYFLERAVLRDFYTNPSMAIFK